MFIGHFGLGFGAKRVAPTVSLGALFLACQFADLLWPLLLLLGVERVAITPGITKVTPLDFVSYPYSHSLLMLCVRGLLIGAVYVVATHSAIAAGVTLGLLAVSHWVLDVIVHRPDMPLTPAGATRLGLDLWSSLAATFVVEFAIFGAGVYIYARATTARDRIGSIGLWALVVFLGVVMVANVLGPPPPTVTAIAWAAQAMWLLVLWGYWIDRHRIRAPS